MTTKYELQHPSHWVCLPKCFCRADVVEADGLVVYDEAEVNALLGHFGGTAWARGMAEYAIFFKFVMSD